MTMLTDHLQQRNVMRWGRNLDKDMNPLEETEYLFIRDMDSDHIQAILDGDWCRDTWYIQVFYAELLLRDMGEIVQGINYESD